MPHPGASYSGVPASGGIVAGTAFHIHSQPRTAEVPSLGLEALHHAIATAIEELEALKLEVGETERDLLDFQIALLCDPELFPPLQDDVGNPVQRWMEAFQMEIASLKEHGDSVFTARAIDYEDALLRVTGILCGRSSQTMLVPEDHILVAEDLTPSAFLVMNWSRNTGIALAGGSDNGHLAMLARAKAIPMVCRLDRDVLNLEGRLYMDAGMGTLSTYRPIAGRTVAPIRLEKSNLVRLRKAGIGISLNINSLSDFEAATHLDYDGVGLVRTEFLTEGMGPRDVGLQHALYRRVVDLAKGRPVTFRTFDFGDDKRGGGFAENRDLDAALDDEETFRAQCRALLRTTRVYSKARILFPMVSSSAAFQRARAIVMDEQRLLDHGSPRPPLGMMVESMAGVDAMASCEADFFCVGSNDLAASIYGVARHAGRVETREPGLNTLFQVLNTVVSTAARKGLPIQICGEIASQPSHIEGLLGVGFRHFSIPPALFMPVAAEIQAHIEERQT